MKEEQRTLKPDLNVVGAPPPRPPALTQRAAVNCVTTPPDEPVTVFS